MEDAKKLLTAYAFSEEQAVSESLGKIMQEIVVACERLPLTLEILGKHLRSRRSELWAEIPIALERCTKDIADLDHRLWARLQLSYDGLLGNEVKTTFLDIASFYVLKDEWGWRYPFDADDSIMAWSSFSGSVKSHLDTLEDRSLVTVRRDEVNGVTRTRFYMHEHLRRMGQRIAREKGRSLDLLEFGTRIRWSAEPTSESQNLSPYDEEVVFQGGKEKLEKILGHRIKISKKSMGVLAQTCSLCCMHELWPKLAAIQFMDLRIVDTDCCELCWSRRVRLPSTLVLLRLQLPQGCALIVEAGGNSVGDLSGTLSLSAYDIVGKQAISVGSCPQLRSLLLKCRAIADLADVFRYSTALESLDLELEEVVPDIFGHLKNLQDLRLECSGLENNLVESWGKLTRLEFLISKDRTSELKVTLDLRSDRRNLEISLKGQPGSPGIFEPFPVLLTRVENFTLMCEHGSTTALARNMINLNHFALHGQQPVQDIFGCLRNLREFELECSDVENGLVESFRNMMKLEELTIVLHGQQTVRDIFGHLQNLQKFKLVCNSIENSLVESLGNMISLEYLSITVQGQQIVRDTFLHLQKLRRFRLVCSGIENNLMGSLGKLTSLELHVKAKHESAELEIKYRKWPVYNSDNTHSSDSDHDSFDEEYDKEKNKEYHEAVLDSQPLKIRLKGQQAESSILEPLPLFLRTVGELDLKCEHGAQTAVVRNMIHLESLQVVVEGSGAVPDVFGGLQKLRYFILKCHAVEDNLERSFGPLSSLQALDLRCETMERFPHALQCFSTLVHLCISCPSLRALPPMVGNFIGLRSFNIFASGLESLPDSLGQLLLRKLSMFGCNHLTTLPESLGELSTLVTLKVRRCQNFRTLPESVGRLSNLRVIDLEGSALQRLPDTLKNLSQLGRLNISRCSNLDRSLAIENIPQVEYESSGSSGSDRSYDPDSTSIPDSSSESDEE
ncbi:hypothetical protein R1sor_016725 [Riccia sorocarpa]|uniref:Disease resistance R13L4/SHOC-2-like LRR domain-containing protein n=1 Tax=Riccia sorocarpa TaxID=122646 RepID=A0ABD3HK03_9MARC